MSVKLKHTMSQKPGQSLRPPDIIGKTKFNSKFAHFYLLPSDLDYDINFFPRAENTFKNNNIPMK